MVPQDGESFAKSWGQLIQIFNLVISKQIHVQLTTTLLPDLCG